MSRSPRRRVLRIYGVALASVIVSFVVFVGGLVAFDECHERWPQQTELALVWTMEILGIGDGEQRYVTALHLDGGAALMARMHAHGFDPNRRMGAETPLSLALGFSFGEALRPEKLAVILDAGADPNLTDGLGYPPIVMAAHLGVVEHLRLLLDHGARPNVVDPTGRTAVDHLGSRGSDFVGVAVALLLDRGLDPCTTVRRRAGLPERYGVSLSDWLAAEKLPDLARRAEAACAAKRAGEGAP